MWQKVRNSLGSEIGVWGGGTDPIKQKIHSVGETVVAFVLVGWGGLAGGLGSAFGWAGLDLPGARIS